MRRIQNRGYATLDRLASHLDRLSAGDESNAAIDAVNAVNLMTVHAAKGLEFPVVFVVNLARGSGTTPSPVRVVVDAGQGEPDVSVGNFRSDADEEEKTRDLEETKRLLYVALTRARDRLYLGTTTSRQGFRPSGGSLGEVLPDTVRELFSLAARDPALTTVTWTPREAAPHALRVCRPADAPAEDPTAVAMPSAGEPEPQSIAQVAIAGPAWTPTTVTALVRDTGARATGTSGERAADAVSGRLVHRLFQQGLALDVTREALVSLALRLLHEDEVSPGLDSATVAEDAGAAYLALRSRDDLRELLSSGRALFEVPFSWRDDETRAIVRGTIDCLAPRADGSWVVVEFKTGGRAGWHEAQLERYVIAARALFPGRQVEGWLLYASDSGRGMYRTAT